MPELHDLLERRASGYEPSLELFERVVDRRRRRDRNRRIGSALVALLVAGVTIAALLRAFSSGTVPASEQRDPFLGTWVSISDADGGTQTMTIEASAGGAVEITVADDIAWACSGTSSTMTGTGRIEGGTTLVIPSPVYTCDDGSEPRALGGPPLQEQLRDWTLFLDPQTETLSDGVGGVWLREGAEDPTTTEDPLADLEPVWPQTSLEEVRQAQELADAGDPRYTWQVDPGLMSGWAQPTDDTEIVARFLREELGWQRFRLVNPAPDPDIGASYDNGYIRCAPGTTNPLYPNDPRGGGCAPTMDDGRYERVSLDLGQLVRQDDSGIWVVTRWELIAPFEQVVPLSDADTTAFVGGFLQARIDGEGAREFLDVPEDEIPFLYATSTGAPYVRSEFEIVDGPVWPEGSMRFRVRLFAEGGETVEQHLSLERPGEGLLYESEAAGPEGPIPGTTVNGEAVPVPYRFLDGEVTFRAAYPWQGGPSDSGPGYVLIRDDLEATVKLLVDPRPIETGCEEGPALADAHALARTIRSDPDLETAAPVAMSVGGVDALRIDVVTAAGASFCEHPIDSPFVMSDAELFPGYGMRLYLLDLPGGPARILAIAIVAPTAKFDRAVELAVPIIGSVEFHKR